MFRKMRQLRQNFVDWLDTIDNRLAGHDTKFNYWNNITSSARLFGGEITDNADGTITVAAGAGLWKAEDAGAEDTPATLNGGQGSEPTIIEWDEVTNLALLNGYNYIYVDGTDGVVKTTLDFYSISFTQAFTIGRVYYDGATAYIRLCGTNAWNMARRLQLFGEEVFPVKRAKGLMISATGRTIQITEGVLWAELLNRFTVPAFDSDGADTFSAWYRDGSGSWTEIASQAEVDNTQYDDGSGSLAELTSNRYGVHWVYIDHTGGVHVVFGQGDYKIEESKDADPPASIPPLISAYGTLVGKLIIQKSGSVFTEITSPFTSQFESNLVTNHNDLSALQGGNTAERYHITANEYNTAVFGWEAVKVYGLSEIVSKNGIIWQSQQAANSGNDPETDDGTWWLEKLALHNLNTAENDFLLGSPSPFGRWIKKTLAETKAILNIVLSFTAEAIGFTISGGTTSKTLTVTEDTTLAGGTHSGTNTGDETADRIASLINGTSDKATPANTDLTGLVDSADSNKMKKLSWANIKATLKTYFDTLYELAGSIATHAAVQSGVHGLAITSSKTLTVSENTTLAGNASDTEINTGSVSSKVVDPAELKESYYGLIYVINGSEDFDAMIHTLDAAASPLTWDFS